MITKSQERKQIGREKEGRGIGLKMKHMATMNRQMIKTKSFHCMSVLALVFVKYSISGNSTSSSLQIQASPCFNGNGNQQQANSPNFPIGRCNCCTDPISRRCFPRKKARGSSPFLFTQPPNDSKSIVVHTVREETLLIRIRLRCNTFQLQRFMPFILQNGEEYDSARSVC